MHIALSGGRVAVAGHDIGYTDSMKVIVTIPLVQVFPKRYEWRATRPNGTQYSASSTSLGSSHQTMEHANRAFENPIKWDWDFARRASEETGTPVHRGHVFLAEA